MELDELVLRVAQIESSLCKSDMRGPIILRCAEHPLSIVELKLSDSAEIRATMGSFRCMVCGHILKLYDLGGITLKHPFIF